MPHRPSFERDIGPLRRRLDDAAQGMRAAEAVFSEHSQPDVGLTAINFPLEENLLHAAAGLLADWTAQAAMLLRRLDTATQAATLQFERLFDDKAGRESEGFLRRRVHLGHEAPETIAAELADLLALSAALDRMLREVKPALVQHHHNCEVYLLRLIARRRRIDLDLEAVGRQMAALKTQTNAHRTGGTVPHDPASEEERRGLALARQAAAVAEESLQAERQTLMRMIADDEDFVEALNAGSADVNVLAAKLAVDIEQGTALLKAADAQSQDPIGERAAPVQALLAAFDANIVAGHDLLARKRRVDDAFSRRLEAAQPPAGQPASEDPEAEMPATSPPPPI